MLATQHCREKSTRKGDVIMGDIFKIIEAIYIIVRAVYAVAKVVMILI